MLDYLIYIAMGLVLITLIAGLVTLWRGDSADRSLSNKLMRMRVLFQFIAIILLALAVFVFRK